jgi:hypothetical protein
MRVETTPSKLAIYSRPWGLWLFLAMFPIFGLFFLENFLQVHSLVCHRTEREQGTCEISHFTAFGKNSRKFPLRSLNEAILKRSSTYKYSKQQVVLTTKDGQELYLRPVTDNFDNLKKQEIVSSINYFLHSQKQLSLTIEHYPDTFISILLLAWNGAFCLALIHTCQNTDCIFDKKLGTIFVKKKGLFGTKTEENSLREITDVIVNRPKSAVPVSLKLGSGRLIDVYMDGSFSSRKKTANRIARLIRDFLDND